ncbi:MAG: T9SS type A sorting domain-containing protein [Bacteroidota bacterium]|nr:T9SS type A sorting domain-containing protein [Bacteroidota bacterium]
MKTSILKIVIVVTYLTSLSLRAADVIYLGKYDDITTVITNKSSYLGKDVVVIIPQGYTNPLSTNYTSINTLAENTRITFRGDGTMPVLKIRRLNPPPNLAALKFEDLTISGAMSDPTQNYIINVASSTVLIDTIAFSNCNISTFRSLVRFQSTDTLVPQRVKNIYITNCKICNFADYGAIYNNKAGSYMDRIKVKNSTFYGFGLTVFYLQTNTGQLELSDCTFDNTMLLSSGSNIRYLIDLGTSQKTPVTISNCIFGKSGNPSVCIRSSGTLSIDHSYITTDFYAADSMKISDVTGAFTTYPGASTDFFTSPSTSTPGATFINSGINYRIKDNSFVGANSAGDPRWYLDAIDPIPNSGFENWEWLFANYGGYYMPKGWFVAGTAVQTSDTQSGKYALRLQNNISGLYYTDRSGLANTAPPAGGDWGAMCPAFEVSKRHTSLNGYYKFIPAITGDSCQFFVFMYKHGFLESPDPEYPLMGYAIKCKEPVSTWAPFSINLDYFDDTSIPDSACIGIFAYKMYDISTGYHYEPMGNSVLYVDNLSFDGFRTTEVNNIRDRVKEVTVYPNPSTAELYIDMLLADAHYTIRLYDTSGKFVKDVFCGNSGGRKQMKVDISNIPSGTYLLMITTDEGYCCRKIMVTK